jgi:AcrR family transcriptional regulator
MFNFVFQFILIQMTDKKQHLINTAIQLFAVNGFEGTSMRDLAASADVNLSMINYYFGTKEKLLENLIETRNETTKGILDEIAHNSRLSGMEKINIIIENSVTRIFAQRDFQRVVHQELMLNNREQLQDSIVDLVFPNSLAIQKIIEAGIESGEFKAVDAGLTVASIMGTIHQLVQSRKLCNKFLEKDNSYVPYDDPEFRKRVINHLLQLAKSHLLK